MTIKLIILLFTFPFVSLGQSGFLLDSLERIYYYESIMFPTEYLHDYIEMTKDSSLRFEILSSILEPEIRLEKEGELIKLIEHYSSDTIFIYVNYCGNNTLKTN